MADNFHKGIHIADVALHLGIDRTYLYTLFKTRVGESPQSYLNNLRVKSACELLQNPYSTLESVAFSLGLEPQTLSRMFKRALGLSPTAYKLRVEQEENKRVGRSAL